MLMLLMLLNPASTSCFSAASCLSYSCSWGMCTRSNCLLVIAIPLAGSFIAGYAVASVVFGHLVHYYEPFKLMSIGLWYVLPQLHTCVSCVSQ